MAETVLSLANDPFNLEFKAENNHLKLTQYGYQSHPWLHPAHTSRLFAAYVNGRRYDAANLEFIGLARHSADEGVTHFTARFKARICSLEQHILVYDDTALIEIWPVIHNHSPKACRVNRLDAFSFDLQSNDLRLQYYTSSWGQEFEPRTAPLTKRTRLQTRSGRSSNGQHPWFGLLAADGRLLAGSIAWSGNWIFRFEPVGADCLRLSGGINNWEFEKVLQPGEQLESPPCILALGADLDEAVNLYAQTGRRYWYPRNKLSGLLPVEWNHWWSYEDVDINEQVFARNIQAAAEMGVEVCTLDAGWFGPNEAGTHWHLYRGDWDVLNTERFPHGIRPLAELAHAKGMRFGLWCEIEGLGKQARLADVHPEFVAQRGGERLGYICFGSPAAQEWAYQTLSRLIQEYGCDWIKLDFNLDPGAGCDRTDHGHQAGDGLYEHYRGYYSVLQRIREAYPEVVLESCSSGGLRIDLGLLRQTHLTFLSDPDWPVHDLQIFWGASTMLAPEACLHWSFSDWRMEKPPAPQSFNPHSLTLTHKQLDYYTRISMLGVFGFSQKLPELPDWVFRRLKYHTRLYKEQVRRFVRQAALYRLTGQPRRNGQGERWCAFQYSLPDRSEHLLFVFRLPGSDPSCTIRLRSLQEERIYTIRDLEGELFARKSGLELMRQGVVFQQLLEEDSLLLRIY